MHLKEDSEEDLDSDDDDIPTDVNKIYAYKGRLFCCSCSYSTLHMSRIKAHLAVHSGKRPFTCEVCMKGFIRKGDLKDHFLTHTDERPYSCPICKKPMRFRSSLKYHMNTHKKDKSDSQGNCDVAENLE